MGINGQNPIKMILKKFETKETLERKLCANIVNAIQTNIANYGFSNILLSGGSTPLRLYEQLGKEVLDWSKVNIGLVDERFVDSNSDDSNQKNIEMALNKFSNTKIKVIPMVLTTENKNENLEKVSELYAPFFERIDFCLLGMGEDGHTASLFPFDTASSVLLQDKKKQIGTTQAPRPPHERITCNKKLLLSANKKALLMIGKRKLKVLQDAIDENLPIAAFSSPKNQLKVYYTEE